MQRDLGFALFLSYFSWLGLYWGSPRLMSFLVSVLNFHSYLRLVGIISASVLENQRFLFIKSIMSCLKSSSLVENETTSQFFFFLGNFKVSTQITFNCLMQNGSNLDLGKIRVYLIKCCYWNLYCFLRFSLLMRLTSPRDERLLWHCFKSQAAPS